MELQFVLDDMKTSLVGPAYLSSEASEEEEMDVDIRSVSVEGSERQSDDTDIEVIACYQHIPIAQPEAIVPLKMTTDIWRCVDDGWPEFPWEDLKDLAEFQPTKVEARNRTKSFGTRTNCTFSQCSSLLSLVDFPLSPPLNEQGPSYGRYKTLDRMSRTSELP